jgi:hypothetical protein
MYPQSFAVFQTSRMVQIRLRIVFVDPLKELTKTCTASAVMSFRLMGPKLGTKIRVRSDFSEDCELGLCCFMTLSFHRSANSAKVA